MKVKKGNIVKTIEPALATDYVSAGWELVKDKEKENKKSNVDKVLVGE